jgi:hypothetical protein
MRPQSIAELPAFYHLPYFDFLTFWLFGVKLSFLLGFVDPAQPALNAAFFAMIFLPL